MGRPLAVCSLLGLLPSIGLIFGQGAQGDTPSGPAGKGGSGLSQLVNPGGLQDPVLRWNASLLQPRGDPPADQALKGDYAADTHNDAWDFNEGDVDGITRFSAGIIEPRVTDGKLSFTVGDRPFFYWGDHFDDPDVKGLRLGEDWSCTPLDGWRKWALKMRLKQSLPESEWTLSARQAGSPPQMDKKSVRVTGTDWQEITVEFRRGSGGFSSAGWRRHSLCFEPVGKGNSIEIDWVRVGKVEPRAFVRKRFAITKAVKTAQACFIPYRNCTLRINGRAVDVPIMPLTTPVDVAGYLQAGDNAFAIESDAEYRGPIRVALEACLVFEDGSFRRIYTDKSWKGTFAPQQGWDRADFDDSHWDPVKDYGNVAMSSFTVQRYKDKTDGRDRATGYGIFLDPPYLGPIGLSYPDKTSGADTPPIFQAATGTRVRLALPVCSPPAPYELSYRLSDAFTGTLLTSGALPESSIEDGYHVYVLTVEPGEPGVRDLTVEARKDGALLDCRCAEIALVGRVPQREVPWREVDEQVEKRLIAEINCGDPGAPYDVIEHPGRFKKGDPAPTGTLTAVQEVEGRAYRLLQDAYGGWVAWKVKAENVHLPHLVEVEYPDDRPQNFAAYCRDRTYYYNQAFGAQVCRRGAVWCLNDARVVPLTNTVRKASFICYPQSQYPYLSLELMNLFKDGRRSAVHKIRVYEIVDLPCPRIREKRNGRWFGSQTERPALRAITYYNGFFNGGDAKLFSNIYRYRLSRHHGFLRDWYLTYANMIKRMRFAGENFFMCGSWMYSAPYWPGSRFAPRGTTQNYDNFALMFAMFEANDMFLLPWIEYCNSDVTRKLNTYTDKEVAEGAPTPLVVSKDGHQGVTTAAGSNAYNLFSPALRQDLLELTRELATRYGRYKAFKGVAFISGGLFQPTLYLPPRSLSWDETLDWGWGDATIRWFEKSTAIAVPIASDDPERFAKRHKWVLQNARGEWLAFRTQGITDLHNAIADELKRAAPEAIYYPFLATAGDSLMKAVVMEHKDFGESIKRVGFAPEEYRQQARISLGWNFFPESFGSVNRLAPGLCQTFNSLDQVNGLLNAGDRTAAFLNVIWQEPDYGNFLYPDWVWKGATQNNPNPWFSGLDYPAPFADRLSHMTPGILGFVFTDGLLYTAQNSARRPIGVAYQAIPPGDYVTLEGNDRDRNIVIRESTQDKRHVFYVVNPAWWSAETAIRFSAKVQVTDLVEGETMTADNRLALKLDPYAVRVFQLPADTDLIAAETSVDRKASGWMAGQVEALAYLDRLGVKKTLRGFSLPEPLDVTISRLGYLRHLIHNGEYVKAQRLLTHPWVIRVLDFVAEKRTIDAAGGLPIQSSYRVNVGSDKAYVDSQGQTWLPDQNFNYGAANYGFIKSEPGGTLYRGSKAAVAGADPEIYRSERHRHFGHGFKVPEGTYSVRIHYAEMFKHRPDQDVTDSGVMVNGKQAYPDFNLGNEAGGMARPLVKTIAGVRPVNGMIEIEFSDKKGGCRCQGIEVLPEK